MSLVDLWERMRGERLPVYAAQWQVLFLDGQSLALGPNSTPEERASLSYVGRAGTKMLTGLQRSDSATIFLHGPGALTYNATPASGIIPASAAANVSPCFVVALGIDKWRQALGRPAYRMIVGFNGIAGQGVYEFDDDLPVVTGSLGTLIRDNHTRWLTEVVGQVPTVAPLFYGKIQGEADVAMDTATFLAADTEVHNDALDDIEALTGVRPPVFVWQIGGYVNSVGDAYGPALAQLQLVTAFGGVFAGPIYPYLTADNVVHPGHEESVIMSEVGAYVWAQHEAGVNLSLLPGTPIVVGNTITIPFSGVQSGKTLTFDPVDKYAAYGGLVDHGCEVSGTTISSVTLSGSSVVITAAAPIAGRTVSIAMQSADRTLDAVGGANYPAHRCDIMESAPVASTLVSGRSLKRYIPSCQFVVPA